MDDTDHNTGLPGMGQHSRTRRFIRTLNTKEFHSWIQTGALLVATSWGIYTFVWSDILVPSWAPAHINLSVELRTNATPAERSNTHNEASLTIKADNPSSRKLYLLSNVWQIFGSRRVQASANQFRTTADHQLRSPELMHTERGSTHEITQALAIGRVFDDNMIQPGESISRSISLRIPKEYSSFEINVIIPALTKEPSRALFNGQHLEWGLAQDESLMPMLCRKASSDQLGLYNQRSIECKPISADEIQTKLNMFDSRMQLFTKSEQLIPNLTGA